MSVKQMKLDRDKPFNEVMGHNRYKYSQGGEYFDAQGCNINAPAEIKAQEEKVQQEVERMKEEARRKGLLNDQKPAALPPEEVVMKENLAAEAAEEHAV